MQTPSQTVGPFFHYALPQRAEANLINDDTLGERILLEGTLFDGDGQPVPDALIEIWQADATGIYDHPNDPLSADADRNFCGFGRSATVDHGKFSFRTVKPGTIHRAGQVDEAPHVNLRIFARGMLIHVVTRVYFADEGANAVDPVLGTVAVNRRPTLLARREDLEGQTRYRFDIHLQGDHETVFFNP